MKRVETEDHIYSEASTATESLFPLSQNTAKHQKCVFNVFTSGRGIAGARTNDCRNALVFELLRRWFSYQTTLPSIANVQTSKSEEGGEK